MKPENLLLDENFNLKIADFGFAGPMEGRDGSGLLHTRLGTKNYMAPEIHDGKAYQGSSVDLFALGIILFIMVAQAPPFNTAEVNKDPFYRAISQGKSAAFWRAHTKNKPNGANFFSEEFKNLIISMLQFDPMHRPSISELMYHPWMQSPIPTPEEIKKEFEERNLSVIEQREKEREERRAQREGVLDEMGDASMRANDPPQKQIDVYSAAKRSPHHFFTKLSPDIIEKKLVEYLRADNIDPAVNSDKYEVDFVMGKAVETKNADEHLMQSEADLEEELDQAMQSLDLVQMKMRITKTT